MREYLYVLVILIALILLAFTYFKTRDLFIVFWIGIFLFASVSGIFKFINVNTVPEDVYKVVQKVVDKVGDNNLIRVNNNDEIEILIKDEWVPSSEIRLLSWATDDVTIKYEDREVKIIDSGLTSILKILDKLGFLH